MHWVKIISQETFGIVHTKLPSRYSRGKDVESKKYTAHKKDLNPSYTGVRGFTWVEVDKKWANGVHVYASKKFWFNQFLPISSEIHVFS